MIEATQDTLPAIAASCVGDETIRLLGEFTDVLLAKAYVAPVTFEAHGATVRGLVVTGYNVIWRGGTIQATGGYDGFAARGYGATVGGMDVTFEGVRFIESNRCIVANGATGLSVRHCRFELGQDGIIASRGGDMDISYNTFVGVAMKPTICTLPDGSTIEGLSSRDCVARGGKWRDGWHQDAVQLRNGIDGIRLIGNKVENITQGLVEMNSPSDLPLNKVYMDGNDVAISGFHSITIGASSTNVTMKRNRVTPAPGRKTLIRAPADAVLVDNVVVR